MKKKPLRETESCRQMREYIMQNLAEELTIPSVAKTFSISEKTLRRRIKDCFDKTPSALINQLRMETALGLICHTDTSIKAVANMVGYNDTTSLDHAFARHFGNPPSYYREE